MGAQGNPSQRTHTRPTLYFMGIREAAACLHVCVYTHTCCHGFMVRVVQAYASPCQTLRTCVCVLVFVQRHTIYSTSKGLFEGEDIVSGLGIDLG